MEDRSALFNQLKDFSQRKLKKVETKVVTGTGELLVEKRGAKGLQVLTGGGQTGDGGAGQEPARKLDLQVGFILPGLLFGSEDVAQDKSSLESYGITHILNLDRDVSNKYEDDYNYKTVAIQDKPDFELDKVLDECFDFIDDGRHYGNVFIHCSGTIGLSRSTSICIAYLMNKEKQAFQEAFNNVKEARAFVKPNEGFVKQLKDYEVKLRGAQAVKESGIDDPFALRKKQEIEQEKAMVAGAASVKNRMKMFGANLDTSSAAASGPPSGRSKSASPSPYKQQPAPSGPTSNQNSATSKWSSNQNASSSTTSTSSSAADKLGSKSMTPEPRKSWQQQHQPGGPPPPPPPMPTSSLLSNDKSSKPITTTKISSSNKSSLPPPPPPPPSSFASSKANESSHQDKPAASSIKSRYQPTTTNTTTTKTTQSGQRKGSVASETSEDETGSGQRVFGRRPPPPMKIRGGLSIERHDSTSSDKPDERAKGRSTHAKSSLQLPLKKQFTSDSDGESNQKSSSDNPRAPSPSAALRAAKQQATAMANTNTDSHNKPSGGQLNRSSTKKLLNLIKTKTRTDLTLSDGDENDEIDALLGALENESIENIDWDELGLDENEVKDIIKQGGGDDDDEDDKEPSSSSSSSSSDEDDEDDEEEEEEEEVERSTVHYVIRTK
uniref:Dual specificity protein phosphatase 19 n=1 Tax=Aceria tosichella TaxID=561515 RepID=A0A6G1SGH0_9ACAR